MELELQSIGNVRVRVLLEGQPDIEPDGLAARLAGPPVGGFHDPGTASRGDDKAVVFRLQRQAPRRQEPGELARVLVVPRPLERLSRLAELDLVLSVGIEVAARPQRAERPFASLATVDACRTEKHD